MNAAEIFKKLRIDTTKKRLIMNAPQEYETILSDVIYDHEYHEVDKHSYDFVQVFATSMAELEQIIQKVALSGTYDCLFWICYPKGGGAIKSDIKRDKVWDIFAIANLQAVSQIAIDETWSALRGRPAEAVGK